MAKKLIVGNWKMNPATAAEAKTLLALFRRKAARSRNVEAVVCPPFLYLGLTAPGALSIGAQDVFYEASGPYTGEVSVNMLKSLGVSYVIIGHSEQRALGEGDETINKKVRVVLAAGLTPILCVGERVRDEHSQYLHEVRDMVRQGLRGVMRLAFSKIVVAYEPVWAIGKGKEALDADEALHMQLFIRKTLSDLAGDAAKKLRVLYGGSVDPSNAADFLSKGKMDGLLVGRDSLAPEKFLAILKHAENA